MKTDVTIYKINIDGIYSNVTKIECTRSIANDHLTISPDIYFKSYRSAKKHLLEDMTERLHEWRYAIADRRSIKEQDIEFEFTNY